jgi:6-phosphogluconate dehydrogenase
MRHYQEITAKGFQFVDAGTSGGVWGLKEGYSMMIGGDKDPVEYLRPIFETLAPAADKGWGHVGPAGAGHFVKMIHNGIEYGMMQAYAEGFTILEKKTDFSLDLPQISQIWRYGSVVRSWLLDLTADALSKNPTLQGLEAFVDDSGEGRWTVFEAIDLNVSAPIITESLMRRIRSREENNFTDRMLAIMRNEFGGHEVKTVASEHP